MLKQLWSVPSKPQTMAVVKRKKSVTGPHKPGVHARIL